MRLGRELTNKVWVDDVIMSNQKNKNNIKLTNKSINIVKNSARVFGPFGFGSIKNVSGNLFLTCILLYLPNTSVL